MLTVSTRVIILKQKNKIILQGRKENKRIVEYWESALLAFHHRKLSITGRRKQCSEIYLEKFTFGICDVVLDPA